MRGFFFWEGLGLQPGTGANPYASLLAAALRRGGVELTEGNYDLDAAWLEDSRASHSFLHMNWLDRFYARFDEPANLEAAVSRYADFVDNLRLARRLGYRVIWTVHNLFPHERRYPQLDRLMNSLIAREADHVIAHCQFAADRISEMYDPRTPVQVIPHGNYGSVFPNTVAPAAARARLDIAADRFVYLFFGNARGYKGVAELIAAFRNVADADAILLLVLRENVRSPGLIGQLRATADGDRRIRFATSTFFANEEFQYYLNAADVVTLPFTSVLTSGSAIQALGFGKPLVLPRLGCLPELVGDDAGIVYDPENADGLAGALRQARLFDAHRSGAAALARSGQLDWDPIAERIAALYRG
jgi:beta-1,4-mannosyltransferase